jgi:tetratricopeptide (TPR) repeat protein
MRDLAFRVAVATLVLVLAPACVPPSGPTGKSLDAVKKTDFHTVAGMARAIVEIESALGSDKIKPLQARYEKDYRTDPRDPFKRFLWAYSLKDRNQVWEELTKITKLNDKFYWAYLGMGIILDGWKVDDQAERNFNKALEISSDIAIGYGRLGKMYLRKNNLDAALKLLEEAVGKDPAHLEYRLDLARALDRAGKREEALVTFRQVIAQEPTSFTAHAELGDLLNRKGDQAAAVDSWTQAAGLDQKAYAVRFKRASVLAELKRNQEALPAFQEACELKPDTLACWQVLAKLSAEMEKQDSRVAACEQVVRIDENNLEAHKYLASVYLERGDIERALPSFQEVLIKEKDNLVVLSGLAKIYEQGEEFSQAIEFNEKVLALKPDDARAQAALKGLFARFHILPEPITGKNPERVFARNRRQIAEVYKLRLEKKPGMQGELHYKVTVSNAGGVERVIVARNTAGDQIVDICAFWNLKRSRFPKGFGATYDFELTLKPGD